MTWLEELREFFHHQHVVVLEKLEARVAATEEETKSLAERVVALELAARPKPSEDRPQKGLSKPSTQAESEGKGHDSGG